ncbi:hypothetical protein GCM10010994_42920 [Chelatococcus reniformis]|uniref:TetR family transcriptional regulator n=2 Tax=Chelatococcus reniformis TaxID=1494448 RepID=A0A916XK44_9HYPH|nr:TetR/AcrR family transcriptional regulator [Chelatococcus reniformis]GGC80345.1 hypothetical protein GCM10010994_42920 [Chelatococcus reniformis]
MTLAAERRWREITIPDIARQANVNLADFRDAFPSKGAILGGFARMIDRKVLEASADDLAGEPARERLFDVMMRRIDAMAPYKEALRQIAAAMRSDPLALAALHQVAANSMRFMLAAADIETEGAPGLLRLEGAVAVFARTMETWFEDDDPGLARTMARLDRELGRGERLLNFADDLYRVTKPLRSFGRALAGGPREFSRRMRERSRETPRDEPYPTDQP